MATRQASLGVDILLQISGRRPRSELEQSLRAAVHEGRLKPGTRMPSTRGLAAELGLARNTVAEAYNQLVAEGLLVMRQGAATRVAPNPGIGYPVSERSDSPGPPPRFDLSPGWPTLAGFPRDAWLKAARRAVTAAPDRLFGSVDLRGDEGLRNVLAAYLGRVRGVRAGPDRIVVCSGYRQALSLLASSLRRGGTTTVAAEAYGLAAHRDIVRSSGLELRLLDVDGDGADIDAIPAEADAVLLTPAHQFPLGVTLSAERRADALDWARGGDKWIIENDYGAEFRYNRIPVPAMQSLDPHRVVFAGTASASIAPALNLAWLVLPPQLVDGVLATRQIVGRTGLLEQLALAEFIRSSAYDRHLRRSRLRYRARRDQLLTLLRAHAGHRISGSDAGLHVVLTFTGLASAVEHQICSAAESHGLRVRGLSEFRDPSFDDAHASLVIGYSRPSDSAFPAALDALGRFLAEWRPHDLGNVE